MSSSCRIYTAATSFRCYSNITSSVTSSLTTFCKVAIPLPSPHPILPGSFTLLYFSSVAFITSWHTMFISGSICFLAAYPHWTEHELHEGRGIVYFVHCFSSTPIAGPGTLWYLIYILLNEWMSHVLWGAETHRLRHLHRVGSIRIRLNFEDSVMVYQVLKKRKGILMWRINMHKGMKVSQTTF